jgi:hypothetical protein
MEAQNPLVHGIMNRSLVRSPMNMIRLVLVVFAAFLGLVIYTADIGAGPRYWGWLSRVPLGDKLCHVGFMLTLTALTNLSIGCRRIRLGSRSLLLGTVIVTALVVAEEFSQLWIPGRNFDLLDLSADLAGIACGGLIAGRSLSALRAGSGVAVALDDLPGRAV